METPVYCETDWAASSSLSSSRSMRFCMTRLPRPSGTSFSKTSSKFFETCLKVRSMASSLRWSRTTMSSVMDSADFSSSSRRSVSLSRWSVNCRGRQPLSRRRRREGRTFWYCSKAFLLTCANFLRPSLTLWSCLRSCTEG